MIVRIALAVLLSLAMAAPSVACRGQQGTATLLDALPEAADLGQVVARVEVLEVLRPAWVSTDDWHYSARVKVRVVEAIKGVARGDQFIVEGQGTSCDQAFPRQHAAFKAHLSSWRPFIAGQFQSGGPGEDVFRGAWRKDATSGKWSRAP